MKTVNKVLDLIEAFLNKRKRIRRLRIGKTNRF